GRPSRLPKGSTKRGGRGDRRDLCARRSLRFIPERTRRARATAPWRACGRGGDPGSVSSSLALLALLAVDSSSRPRAALLSDGSCSWRSIRHARELPSSATALLAVDLRADSPPWRSLLVLDGSQPGRSPHTGGRPARGL